MRRLLRKKEKAAEENCVNFPPFSYGVMVRTGRGSNARFRFAPEG